MATKSITKTIRIKNRADARKLADALEHSHEKSCQLHDIDKKSRDLKGEEIIAIFKE